MLNVWKWMSALWKIIKVGIGRRNVTMGIGVVYIDRFNSKPPKKLIWQDRLCGDYWESDELR